MASVAESALSRDFELLNSEKLTVEIIVNTGVKSAFLETTPNPRKKVLNYPIEVWGGMA